MRSPGILDLSKVGGKFSMNMAIRKVENVSEFIKMLTLCKEFLGQENNLAKKLWETEDLLNLFFFLLVLEEPLGR